MASTGIFARLAGALFSARTDPADDIDPAIVDDAVEAIVEAVEPRIRLVPRYRSRLAPVAIRSIRLLRSFAVGMPDPIELSREAWSADRYISAFFATANDIPAFLARSAELRAFLDDAANARCDAAFCLLAMRREERNVFASALVDGQVRKDVPQTTVGFVDHRLFAATGDALTTRRAVGQAILERMAALALERIVAMRERATEMELRKSMLETRLRMLKLRRGSLPGLATGEKDPAAEIAGIEQELKSTVKEHLEARASVATLDASIEQIEHVMGDPERHVGLDTIELRVNYLGYKVGPGSTESASELRLHELRIGPDIRAVIAMVRIPRASVPAMRDPFAP